MGRALKIVGWVGVALAVLFAVSVISSLYRYWSWYPKVWAGRITIDGVPSPTSDLYLDLRRTCGGVVVRRSVEGEEFYAVGFGTCHNWRYVWRCEKSGFSFLPGLAFSKHVQLGQGCIAGNVEVADSAGRPLSEPKHAVRRDLKLERRLIEFNADDGKRVRVAW
jgi:hypothetical protein